MTALTHCPIDGTRIYRMPDGEIECSVALIGNHSKAAMQEAYLAKAASKPVAAPVAIEPCATCGAAQKVSGKTRKPYCPACRSRGGGQHANNVFSLESRPDPGYYFDSGTRMTR